MIAALSPSTVGATTTKVCLVNIIGTPYLILPQPGELYVPTSHKLSGAKECHGGNAYPVKVRDCTT